MGAIESPVMSYQGETFGEHVWYRGNSSERTHPVRKVFGPDCTAKGLASWEKRFMSGDALDQQPLVERGYISMDGEYVGGPWY
jgi:hypothetical protein